MSTTPLDGKALCPFYVNDYVNEKSITCEGIIGKFTITRFKNKFRKDEHTEVYCTTENYKKCTICQLNMKKYEGDC